MKQENKETTVAEYIQKSIEKANAILKDIEKMEQTPENENIKKSLTRTLGALNTSIIIQEGIKSQKNASDMLKKVDSIINKIVKKEPTINNLNDGKLESEFKKLFESLEEIDKNHQKNLSTLKNNSNNTLEKIKKLRGDIEETPTATSTNKPK